jgi:transcriptional regulator with XRE-family HTH domain
MTNRLQIGTVCKATRNQRGLTQEQVSNISGINKAIISRIENGKFTGSFDIVERYLDSIGLELQAIPKKATLPDWDELDTLFKEDEE